MVHLEMQGGGSIREGTDLYETYIPTALCWELGPTSPHGFVRRQSRELAIEFPSVDLYDFWIFCYGDLGAFNLFLLDHFLDS